MNQLNANEGMTAAHKSVMKKFLLLMLAVLIALPTFAFEYEYEGQTLEYKITDSATKTCAVAGNSTISGDLIIPETVSYNGTTYTVTEIGNQAFYGSSGMTSVSIPNSIYYIGLRAFYGCTGLTKAEFASIESLCKIDFEYYDSNPICYAHNLWVAGKEVKELIIPESITEIKFATFNECSSLTTMEIPNSVTSIGGWAFSGCSGLTSINIPNSVTFIGGGAFCGCSGLTSINIPNSVTSIESSAFSGCSGLTSINIPNSVTTIGYGAFYNCSSLTSVNIPANITSLGDVFPGGYVWGKCDKIKEVNYLATTPIEALENIFTTAVYRNATLFVPTGSKANYEKVTPWKSFNNIQEKKFSGGVEIGASFEYEYEGQILKYTITDTAAKTCAVSSKNTVTGDLIIPETVSYNGTTYTVTFISEEAFQGCTGLTSVRIPNSVTSIGHFAFAYNGLTSVEIPNSVKEMGYAVFQGCSGLTSAVIGNSLTTVSEQTFCECTSLTSVEIPNSVTIIDGSAFYDCSSLTSLEIPNSVTKIEGAAFCNSGLTSVVIPNSVKEIGNSAFHRCTDLTSVTISANITSFGYYVWDECNNIKEVNYLATTPLATGADIFTTAVYKNATLFVPVGSKASYETVTPWKSFNNIQEKDFSGGGEIGTTFEYEYEGQTLKYTITDSAAKTCAVGRNTVTGDLVIPETVSYNGTNYIVTAIGKEAFSGCTGLMSVKIPNSVISIGDYAFNYCINLASVEIPDSVTTIGDRAFYHCISLTSVTIGNSVTSIGELAFFYCTSLTSVEIPNSVKEIGDGVFYGCSGLTSVVIGNSVTSIGAYAFYQCTDLTTVTIGNSVTTIGEDAFKDCTGLTKAEFASVESLCKIDFENYAAQPLYYAHNLWVAGKEVKELIIPESITEIKFATFFNCTNLTSVKIPNSVTKIGRESFWGCRSLTSVEIPNSVTSIGGRTFEACRSLTSVEIPNSVTSIGSYAFAQCFKLTSVKISNSVTIIESGTFSSCGSLASVEIPECVTEIGGYAFFQCTGLTSVEIPNSVKEIQTCAFYRCSGLTSVTIPANITSFGNEVWKECDNIKEVNYLATTPIEAGADLFTASAYANATLFVPETSKKNYEEITPWNLFGNIQEKKFSGVEEIDAEFDGNAPCEVFNINGVKVGNLVENLAPGIYIMRQGDKTKKIVVK